MSRFLGESVSVSYTLHFTLDYFLLLITVKKKKNVHINNNWECY